MKATKVLAFAAAILFCAGANAQATSDTTSTGSTGSTDQPGGTTTTTTTQENQFTSYMAYAAIDEPQTPQTPQQQEVKKVSFSAIDVNALPEAVKATAAKYEGYEIAQAGKNEENVYAVILKKENASNITLMVKESGEIVEEQK